MVGPRDARPSFFGAASRLRLRLPPTGNDGPRLRSGGLQRLVTTTIGHLPARRAWTGRPPEQSPCLWGPAPRSLGRPSASSLLTRCGEDMEQQPQPLGSASGTGFRSNRGQLASEAHRRAEAARRCKSNLSNGDSTVSPVRFELTTNGLKDLGTGFSSSDRRQMALKQSEVWCRGRRWRPRHLWVRAARSALA